MAEGTAEEFLVIPVWKERKVALHLQKKLQWERSMSKIKLIASDLDGTLKCTLCQGHYDFSFSDFYFIFVCCVEASK